ncbi:unknown protein [Paenibacillus amylolyticus]|uniref:Uncharacterized protein n=1 Tax=Paenibacillus amylolyticus TaxID=1451 RepID=A0A117I257_PAEAM|nr:unknown protein [Paenibacillus amylolyticus]
MGFNPFVIHIIPCKTKVEELKMVGCVLCQVGLFSYDALAVIKKRLMGEFIK